MFSSSSFDIQAFSVESWLFDDEEHHGGGWGHHRHRRKTLKQLKKQYYVLPYTLLEDTKEGILEKLAELSAKLKANLAKTRLDWNLTDLIALLEEEIAYEKLKLEAIEYAEERKKKIAENNKREKDVAMIAIYMMDDEND